MSGLYRLLRPLLFQFDPERAHGLSLSALELVATSPWLLERLHDHFGVDALEPVEVAGLRFSNRVGLAAGYDKDGRAWRGAAALGFGHIEVGTVTPLPQAGNPRPRVFRLTHERAVINRLGFPSDGAHAVRKRLSVQRPFDVILGVNLGKNKDTPLGDAARDYIQGVEIFADVADYLVVNVSSPNTVGLRRLQARDSMAALIATVAESVEAQRRRLARPLPLFVKLAPDLDAAELDDAIASALDNGCDGLIATNTTVDRPPELRSEARNQSGGLSGAPLFARSLATVERIASLVKTRAPIIAVGGVSDAEDGRRMLEAGASLVQVYTAMIYKGPGLAKGMLEGGVGG